MNNGQLGFICGIVFGLILGTFILTVLILAKDVKNRFEASKRKRREGKT